MGSAAEIETDEMCESLPSELRASTDMTSVPKRCSTGRVTAALPRPEILPSTSPLRRHVYVSSDAGTNAFPRLKRGSAWRRRLVPAAVPLTETVVSSPRAPAVTLADAAPFPCEIFLPFASQRTSLSAISKSELCTVSVTVSPGPGAAGKNRIESALPGFVRLSCACTGSAMNVKTDMASVRKHNCIRAAITHQLYILKASSIPGGRYR